MQTNSNRKGLALGAAFALIVSMFGTVPAASAATDGSDIGAYPVAGTTFAGALDSDFPVYTQLKQDSNTTLFTGTNVVYKIEKTAGADMDVVFTASAAVDDLSGETAATAVDGTDTMSVIVAGSTSATTAAIISGGVAHLNFKASSTSGRASWSAVTLKVTAWIDTQGGAKNDAVDTDELFTTFTVTLGDPTATLTMTQPLEGDTVVTVSSTITGVNHENVKGSFFLAMSSSNTVYNSSVDSTEINSAQSGSALALKGGVLSSSVTVASLSSSDSISAAVRYIVGTATDIYGGELISSVTTLGASAATITALNSTVLASDHSTASSNTAAAVRPNQTYTVRVHALTNSVSVSGQVVTVALGGTSLVTGSKLISVNGGAALTAYPDDISVTTGADGYGSFTITTTGFIGGETVTVDATSGNVDASTLTLTATTPAYSIVNDYDLYATTPGTAVNLTYAVEDQWQVAAVGTFQIKTTKGGTGFAYAQTVSNVAVASGAATFAFTPTPVAKTGSAVVSTQLQKWNTDLAAWVDEGSAGTDITVTVTSVADAMSVSPAASTSASISYFPSTVSYETITGTAKNAGSSVVISGDADSLVFRASAAVPATTSGGITVRAASDGTFTFDVASLHEGTFTISYGIGASSTTSLLVVDPAAADSGKSITFDSTSIPSDAAATLTGTLVDMNGNAVNTSGSATIVVTYVADAGNRAGVAIGTMPTETDADGQFSVNVLTGGSDNGTATLTAVYLKDGPSTATADKLTVVQAITVGTVAGTQKVNAGSFKGYVAVYARGYEGQRLSAKIGKDWVIVDPIVNNQENGTLFRVTDFTGAGVDIAVRIYIDRVLIDTINLTTK